jgi:signal transduction histidine kinase
LQGQGLGELLDHVRLTGQPYLAQEWPMQLARHQPGTTGYFSFVYQPLRAADGEITGIMCVATDMTTQVLARQQVQNLNEELAAINEEMQATNEELGDTNRQLTRTNVDLDNFIYTASHDLKQPIANIEGLLQALTYELPAEARQAPQVRPILERMHAAVERFQKTIGDLTEISKLQLAHAQPAREVLLHQVIEEVALDLDPVLLAAQGQLEVAVPPGQVVTFSEKNLRSIVYNLLSNAVKYRAPDRPLLVHISSQEVGSRVELRVQDNGLGLDAAQQSRLFGLFQRLHTHVEGTGIGLYMVKKIVENAGGSIVVQSEQGVGSSFVVSLPN